MSSPDDATIVCRTTPWYVRRMVPMFLMFAFFAGWFYRDYRWKYPEEKNIYDEYQRVTSGPGGEEAWKKLSADKGWPLLPEKRTQDEIQTQKQFAIGCAVVAAGVLGVFLFNRGRTLRADAEAFYTPGGRRVPFASVFRIDRRKWKRKGLATVWYRDTDGTEKKAVIDDLKFGGADRILDRLLSHFSGELIDLEPADAPAADAENQPPADTRVER
jgi:hypothetical protein